MPQNKLGWNGLLGISSGWMALTTAGPIQRDLLGTHLDPHIPYANLHSRTQPSGFYLIFSWCPAFSSTLFFPSFSQWSLEFISIRLPSGFLGGGTRHRTIHSSSRTLPMNPVNSKCKKRVACSHQCHKIVPKIKVTRSSQPELFNNPDCICSKACEGK